MTHKHDTYAKLLNASGFAFQLAVEAAVRGASNQPWRIAAREYPWSTAGTTGYIDLVLSNENVHLVVECKRNRDASWLFLMPDGKQMQRSHARVRWTDTFPHRPALSDWGDVQIYPASPQAEFCVVRGQGERDAPLLERIAAGVATAAEGFAADLLQLDSHSRRTRVVIPVIVTNADLVVTRFDPAGVSLETGDVASPEFAQVKHLRFRKSLGPTTVPDEYEPEKLRDLSQGAERTVFVVSAEHLVQWLGEFEIGGQTGPWESARLAANAMAGL